MDYAFAPGTTGYDNSMKALLRLRPGTTLIDQQNVRSLSAFINHLNTASGVTRPVHHFIIASHGNDAGWMQMALAPILIDLNCDGVPETLVNDSRYEALVSAVSTGVLRIPNALILPRPAGAGPAFFHIRGCKIGQPHAVPFVQKLKEALGGQVQVTAPKHFHLVTEIRGVGAMEYMGHDFSLARPTAFANRNAMITAFQGANFTFIDGSAVPNNRWTGWFHRNISQGKRNRAFTLSFDPPLQRTATRQISSMRINLANASRHEVENFPYTITYSSGAPPTDVAGRQNAIRNSMMSNCRFDPARTGFPVYRSFEFDTFNDFWNGFTWSTPTWNAQRRELRMVGTRHKYTIIVPVTNPANNDSLFMNFYPVAGNTTPLIRQLQENDARFFLTC